MLVWLSSIGKIVFVVSVGLAGIFLFILVFKNKKFQISMEGVFIAILILAAGTGVFLGDLLDAKQGTEHIFSTLCGSIFSIPAALFGGKNIWQQTIHDEDGQPSSRG